MLLRQGNRLLLIKQICKIMCRIAVIITVYNRKEITLKGLRSLNAAIALLGKGYIFDVYLTDDGSTDGTAEAVKTEFPTIIILEGNGTLFWGGGMNFAWQAAVESKQNYDYFLWFNDDSDIYPNALQTMFETISENVIVTGAFQDHEGKVSYGGKTKKGKLIIPNSQPQDVEQMNGNLVLIPYNIFHEIGLIDKHYLHGGGDFEYGYRAREKGYKVVLTPKYVGIADRHDEFIPKYCNINISLKKRWEILHNPINSPKIHFRFNLKRKGFLKAVIYYLIGYVGVLLPSVYVNAKKILNNH